MGILALVTMRFRRRIAGLVVLVGVAVAPLPALADGLEQAFDRAFGYPAAAPHVLSAAPASPLAARLSALAEASQGRIGVAAIDLARGEAIGVLGDQPFPLASTGKVAIVATFLDGVDRGVYQLSDQFPLMLPVPSHKFAGTVAPVRAGAMLPADRLIELALTRSDNHATDALLAAIGGPQSVDRWLHRAGITGMHLDRDIATMVRDDGAINPARVIDVRDSTTPQAMARLLAGLYQGQWLTPSSRDVLLGAMGRCVTGVHRMKALLPEDALVGHKTGTLANVASDVGILRTSDGRAIALAIYVTGQGSRPGRETRIAEIARAVYDGYQHGGYPDGPQGEVAEPGIALQ